MDEWLAWLKGEQTVISAAQKESVDALKRRIAELEALLVAKG
jgi:hypothetical protein